MNTLQYTIVETDSGPFISDSRTTVYDVLEMVNQGFSPYEIADTYNLTRPQVQVALEYIAEHRQVLESELQDILKRKAEREAYHRAVAAKIQRQISELPMTPQRAALYALIGKNHQAQEASSDADRTQ